LDIVGVTTDLDDILIFGDAEDGPPESIRCLLIEDGMSGENKVIFLPAIGEEGAAKVAVNNVWPAEDATRPTFLTGWT
jgi:hypothetical protein